MAFRNESRQRFFKTFFFGVRAASKFLLRRKAKSSVLIKSRHDTQLLHRTKKPIHDNSGRVGSTRQCGGTVENETVTDRAAYQ